jgi:hypothetical protein
MKSKEQIELEKIYSDLDSKNLNEGISGIYPEEANSVAAAVVHLAIPLVLYALYKIGELKDQGKIQEIQQKIKQLLSSDIDLKNKFMSLVKSKSVNQSPNEQDLKRKELGIPPVKTRKF